MHLVLVLMLWEILPVLRLPVFRLPYTLLAIAAQQKGPYIVSAGTGD